MVRVVPLAKLPAHAPAVLDYFWPDALALGSLVRASIGKRVVLALVLDTQDIRSAKLSLKKSSFALKKLSGVISETPQLSGIQIELAKWISAQYFCSLATALTTVAPPFIGKRGSLADHRSVVAPTTSANNSGIVYVAQPDTALKKIREIIASSTGQTFLLVPDRFIARSIQVQLGTDAHLMHSGLSATDAKNIYRHVLDGSLKVLVGTRSGLFLPWSALTHIIVEDPLNELYKSDMTPRLNAPDVARHLATLHHAQLTWLTAALSTVQYHLTVSKKLTTKYIKPLWPAITLSTTETQEQAGHRSLFGRPAQDALLDAYEQKTPLLMYSARRGYATIARCARCRASVACATCAIPLRWHRTSEDMLVCYHCGAFNSVPKQCPTCHAGVLKPSGTPGSQKLVEAINTVLERFGHEKIKIPILDSDLVQTPADVQRTLSEFDAMQHPVLVATSMIHSHRYERTFQTIVVPHMDMLATNPDYRTQDRLLLQLEKLADFKPERIILQTFQDDGLAPFIVQRDWDAFFTQELAHRKSLRWPPYSRIIKLSFSRRDKGVVSRAAGVCADRLSRAIAHLRAPGTQLLGPAPALVERSGGRWTQHIILKSTLPSSRLSELLQYTPEGWLIDVDPRSIS